MKKILLALLLILLVVLTCLTIFNGMNLFGIEICGITQIREKNDNLNYKIAQATTMASTEYPKALSDIQTNLKKLEQEKKNYEDMVTINNGEQMQLVNQYQKYEVEYLWTIIGNHATKEGVVIKIDIVAASGNNKYNLNFTVNGSYIGITEFISDIENDSALGFKIENFTMKPGGSTQELQTTFTCKDIEIKDITKSSSSTKANNSTTDVNNNVENISNETNPDEDLNSNSTTNTDTTNGNKATNTTTNSTSGSTTNTTSSNTTNTSTSDSSSLVELR